MDRARRSAEGVPGSETFLLIQDRADAHRFISFGTWADWAAVDTWRESEAFAGAMRACRELCDDFRPNDSTLRVAAGA